MVPDPEMLDQGMWNIRLTKGELIGVGVLSHDEIFITLARVPGDCVNMQ